MPAKNSDELIQRVGELIKSGKTNHEIAAEIGKSRDSVAIMAGRHFGGNPNYLKRRTKHAHLRGAVLLFRMNHSDQETMDHFKLTASELKSCVTCAYKIEELSHLRKDTRSKVKWTENQILTMLKYSGILRRALIGSIIGRGGARVVKEKLQHLNVSSRNINGANLTQFRQMFGFDPEFQIRGEAVPGSIKQGHRNRFVIVPWPYVVKCYKAIPHDKSLLKMFETYAMFQAYIWKGDPWRKMVKDHRVNKYLVIYKER